MRAPNILETIQKYSINLMWINIEKDNKSPFISADKRHANQNEFKTDIISPAVKWSKANPDSNVCLWYDSELTTSSAVNNTKELLKDIKNLELRDIRDIPCVINNPDIFTPRLPIYFRIDLLKLIILLDSIDRDKCDAAVFSDLEVGDKRKNHDRMSKSELFNQAICDDFQSTGMVVGGFGYKAENQFIQLYRNPLILDAVRLNINTNLYRALLYLNHPNENIRNKIGELNEIVYATMFQEIGGFYHALTQKNPCMKWSVADSLPPRTKRENELIEICNGIRAGEAYDKAHNELTALYDSWKKSAFHINNVSAPTKTGPLN